MARTVLVTGASSGIGRATVEAFHREGWRVYAGTRTPEAVEPYDFLDKRAGVDDPVLVELDVTSNADVRRVVDRILAEEGRLDCLVNNAGFGQFGPLEDVAVEDLEAEFDVNVFGPHRLVRAAVPAMRERGAGTVVNVGSVVDRLPLAGAGAYCGSKAALAAMTAALRQEVGDDGVDVVLVEPGLVATGFHDRARDALPARGRSDGYEDLYRVLERVGVCRNALPGVAESAAVADVVVAAASSDASDDRYQPAPTGTPGVLAGELLPVRVRDAAVRAAVSVLASAPVQRALAYLDVDGGSDELERGSPANPERDDSPARERREPVVSESS